MSVSKRVKSPAARPQGHGEEENFTTESAEELDTVDDARIIELAIELLRSGKVTLKQSVDQQVRLNIQAADGRKFDVWVRPLADK